MHKEYIRLKEKNLKNSWAIYEYEFINGCQYNLIKLIKHSINDWCESGIYFKKHIEHDYYIKTYKSKSSMLKDNFDLLLKGV